MMRVVIDYRPALRHRSGVGEYTHELARALLALAAADDSVHDRPIVGASGDPDSRWFDAWLGHFLKEQYATVAETGGSWPFVILRRNTEPALESPPSEPRP